jgi:citrate synthase
MMSYDPAFKNTASTISTITEIDGDKGILRYRGYPIEQLAEKSNYLEVAYLLLFGELPTQEQYKEWEYDILHHTFVHENIKDFMQRSVTMPTRWACSSPPSPPCPPSTPKGATLKIRKTACARFMRLIAKVPTVAAFSYRHSRGSAL